MSGPGLLPGAQLQYLRAAQPFLQPWGGPLGWAQPSGPQPPDGKLLGGRHPLGQNIPIHVRKQERTWRSPGKADNTKLGLLIRGPLGISWATILSLRMTNRPGVDRRRLHGPNALCQELSGLPQAKKDLNVFKWLGKESSLGHTNIKWNSKLGVCECWEQGQALPWHC